MLTPDTGTSLLTFPSWAMEKFDEDYPAYANGIPCESEFVHGDLNYVIDGVDYLIPSHHWM